MICCIDGHWCLFQTKMAGIERCFLKHIAVAVAVAVAVKLLNRLEMSQICSCLNKHIVHIHVFLEKCNYFKNKKRPEYLLFAF